MKTILKVFGGIVLGFVALGIIGIVLITQCLPSPPETVTPAPLPSPTQEKAKENLITDLAYMKVVSYQYSDDADPEPEGAEINLLWYDSKSELIFTTQYKDITLQVTMEIFAAKSDEYPIRFTEPVYKTEIQVTHPFEMRIPFEDINTDRQIHNWAGRATIIVHTPQQGDFSIEDVSIPLFPYEKPKE